MVQQCNPGSAAYIHLLDKTSTFQRMFVSFEAQMKGFLEGCMPFIGIDECHLKGPYGGVLLSAIALNANSSLYPLAYCIYEGETFLNWSWFLEQLRVFLRYPAKKPICFMSDRHKGVISALKMQWPRASIMVSYGGQKLKNLLWKAAKTIDRAYTTNLSEKTCERGQWQVSGVPCSHALAGIRYHFGVHGDEDNFAGFIDPMSSKSAYLRTYSPMIHPIPDLCVWANLETIHVDAPPLKRLPGRPRLVRNRESADKQKAAKTRTVMYGNCRQPGHNSRSCKSKNTSSTTKKKKVQNTTETDVSVSSSQSQGAATSSQPPTKVYKDEECMNKAVESLNGFN
ncbi:hypothetical protein EZV62_025008 [Acer yangbiense]|uniref:MULE transposase domain-containing protein n=1 Tax=Acer yangbiense TaxID=1000413 RepID=A0A5C7GWL4_9ROSI|nr:hypothetical protein EZV62_025008 [Acer yangbiense]